ncbi:DUF3105 domain-containing protein [Nostocoides veronense]|uniref:DUF3105 domain-containing protein n=1 Tax=Nostocoides veronense TaxID=330836 RepID=A0ABN2LWL0_9MICO
MAKKKQATTDTSAARRAQLEAVRKQQAQAERRRGMAIWGSGLAVLLLIAGVVGFTIVKDRQSAGKVSLDAVKTYKYEGGKHTDQTVKYAENPPVGGEHSGTWLNCGVYDKPVPNENAVHSLEHGAVWVTYDPKLPSADVDKLRKEIPSTYMVLSPFDGLPSPVVASAWGKQLTLTGADDPRLEAFIAAYRQGPQTPEPGAVCTGGMDADGKVS